VKTVGVKFLNANNHSARCSQRKIRFVQQWKITIEGDSSFSRRCADNTELLQLRRDNLPEPGGTDGKDAQGKL
jgi:hypothetical protein